MPNVETYVFFNGNCAEAMKFYEKTLKGKLQMMTEKEAPGAPKNASNKILHARLVIDGGVLMASDWLAPSAYPGMGGFSVSRYVEKVDEAKRLFNELSKGGKVDMPLAKTFWVEAFAMVTDRFGMAWMVLVPQ